MALDPTAEWPDFDSSTAMIKVSTYASFQDLPKAYLPLFDQWAGRSFFYDTAWFRNLVENTMGEDDRVRIYGLELNDGSGAPVAALPTRFRRARGAPWRARKLTSLTNYYSSLFGPELSEERVSAREILRELARAIAADTLRWEVVDLKPLAADSPLFSPLVDSFRNAGMVVQTYFCFGNWYLPVCGRSYREYFEGLPSQVQNTIKRKKKKLAQHGRTRVRMVTGGADLEAAIDAYRTVYAASWKVPEPYPGFIPGLIRLCAEKGWLRLGLVDVDGEPAAAQLWIVNGGVASIYKLAYDERFAPLSLGTILTAQLMEHALDVDKVREVDYLSGDDRYKKDWMSKRRERLGILAFNPRTVHGFVEMLRQVGGRALKNTLRGRSAAHGQTATVQPDSDARQSAGNTSTDREPV